MPSSDEAATHRGSTDRADHRKTPEVTLAFKVGGHVSTIAFVPQDGGARRLK